MKIKLIAIFTVIGFSQILSSGIILIKAHFSVYLIEKAWKKSLKDSSYHKPWSWADTYPIAKLIVKRLNNETIILEGSSGRNLAFSATHLLQSGLPGDSKTIVISAHKDTHFSYLKDLIVGDIIDIKTLHKTQSYKVSNFQIVNSQKSQIYIKNSEELLLTTCYPFNSSFGGPLRIVYTATPI